MSAAASSVLRRSLGDRLWSTTMIVLIAFFVVNVFGVITSYAMLFSALALIFVFLVR